MNSLSTTKQNTSTSIWKTNSTGIDDWVFFGPYTCHIDRNIVVPEGEAGLLFMREFIRKNRREKKSCEPDFISGFVGFVTYEWQAHFVFVDEVFNINVGAATHGAFFHPRARAAARPSMYGLATASGLPHGYMRHFASRSMIPRPSGPKLVSKMHPCVAAPQSNLTYLEYTHKIQRIKDYLYAGDTYQVNFSQKFEMPFNGNAFELYQKLTQINPSPFQFFMETEGFAVISNSPERLFQLRKQDGLMPPTVGSRGFPTGGFPQIIETRPIKGTMPRGKTPEEDEANVAKLIASPKEAAELAMIVDLERNDIGKLCVPGTVEVTEDRTIEKYSHVIHTVANIRGVLVDQYDWYDALKALFPGGSITGCPKKRTMEIINELEGEPRGVYCGSAGWIDLSGDCDFNILIRTLWLEKAKNSGAITFRSGGGIVVDSDSQKEYEETLHKAAAIAKAISEFSS